MIHNVHLRVSHWFEGMDMLNSHSLYIVVEPYVGPTSNQGACEERIMIGNGMKISSIELS